MREDVTIFRSFRKSSSSLYSADEKTENDDEDEDEEENETPLLS